MRYAVIGAGGIGGFLGGALARRGHAVTLVVRPAALAEYPRDVEVSSRLLGDFRAPVSVTSELQSPVDVVLLSVKNPDLPAAVAGLTQDQLGGGLLVPFLNGVEHFAYLRQHYPADQVVAGTIRVEAERTSPGVFRQLTPFASVLLAGPTGRQSQVEGLAADLRDAGLECALSTDPAGILWRKLAFLAPLALTTTAKGGTLGEVRDDPEWRERLEGCLTETCAAARADGVSVDEAGTLALLNGAPDDFRSSMQKDVDAGRPPEVDAIAGPVVRLGERHNFDISVTRDLLARAVARAS